jgi:hypothetical protein
MTLAMLGIAWHVVVSQTRLLRMPPQERTGWARQRSGCFHTSPSERILFFIPFGLTWIASGGLLWSWDRITLRRNGMA